MTGGTPNGNAAPIAAKTRAHCGPRAMQKPSGTPKSVAPIALKTQSSTVLSKTERDAVKNGEFSCHIEGF